MTETFTWRASDEFAAAIRGYRQKRKEFVDTVVHEFNEAHPDHSARFYRHPFSLDAILAGFADDTSDVPEGLSRAKTREYLVPVRGSKGKPWREAMRTLEKMPSIDGVFKAHNLSPVVWIGSYVQRAGIFDDGQHVYIECGGDLTKERPADGTSPHLTPIRLSEYYAVKEAFQDNEKEGAVS